MKALKYILFLSIKSNIWIGLSVVSLTLLTHFYFKLPFLLNRVFVTFFATIIGYSFVQYFYDFKKLKNYNWFKIIGLINILSLLFLLYFYSQLSFYWQIIFFILGIFLVLYIVPLSKNKYFIRKISGIKIYYVSLFITFVTAVLPFVENQQNIDFWFVFQRFLCVMVLILPFEIQSITTDGKNLKTIPQVLGIKKSKFLGLLFVFFMIVIEFYFIPKTFFISLFFYLILGVFVGFSSPKRSVFYTSFWVEILPILWLLTTLYFS